MKTMRKLRKPEVLEEEDTKAIVSVFQLACLHEKGDSVPQNLAKAFEYYYQAATMDVIDCDSFNRKYKFAAIYNVGIMYMNGDGVVQDKQTGLEWIEEAAKNEQADALYYLGQMYEEGKNDAKQDYYKAYQYYLLAAQRNHAGAQFSLGKIYFLGLGVSVNKKEARKWLLEASNKGNVDAKYYLEEDWLNIWPNEDWLIKRDDDKVGKVFGTVSGMRKLQEAIDIYRSRFQLFKEFSLVRDLGIGGDCIKVDHDIAFWLQMVAKRGFAEGHYAVGKYAVSLVKKIKSEMEATSNDDIEKIDYYVAQYVRAKASLTRALQKGFVEAKEYLSFLKEHEECVEILYSSIFDQYQSYAQKDDCSFKAVESFLEADKIYRKKAEKCIVMVEEIKIDTPLFKKEKDVIICGYKSSASCLPDVTDGTAVSGVTPEVDEVSTSEVATSSGLTVEPETVIESDSESEPDKLPRCIHFLFLQGNRGFTETPDETPRLSNLQDFSLRGTSDFNSALQKFFDNRDSGGVIVAPKVNTLTKSNPDFNRIFNNAFSSSTNRLTFQSADIARSIAQAGTTTRASQSASSGGEGSASGGSMGSGGGDSDGRNRHGGGKNAKHANQKAVDSAREQLKEALIERERLKSIANKTAEQREQYEEAKRKAAHLARKAAFRGEHHSQKPKGNR